MLITTLAFFGLTAICVLVHLRARRDSRPPAPVRMTGIPCPRCQAAVPDSAAFCPGCGVPQQIYEVVKASPVAVGKQDNPRAEREHAIVRADLCVGCATCVAACPEAGAIRLEDKLAVVDPGACVGHGDCVAACPVSAIVMASGSAGQRIRVPDISGNFESNIPGLFIVGELGGRGLIKNAINEGKIAAEHIAQRRGARPPSPAEDPVQDVVIVGAGPAGLSAGLEAHRAGMKYLVLERGTLADTIRKYPRKKVLFSEPVRVPLYGDLWVSDASKETLLQVWETIISNTGLDVRTGHPVEDVIRKGELFHVQSGEKSFRARNVILALGRRGTPRHLGVSGEEMDKVFYEVVEMETFRGRRVLVVGGGDSAAESALGLCNQEGTQVTLSYRGDRFKRVKERNQEKLKARVSEGRLALLLNSQVREIRREEVVLDVSGRSEILANDDVVVRVGGDPPFAFLERIGVRIVQKDVPLPDANTAQAG